MRSTAYEGGASVVLEFDAGFDADAALDDVREKVDIAEPELPEETEEPEVHAVNFSLFPVLVVTLSGEVPERDLLRMARDVRDEIKAMPAVLDAQVSRSEEHTYEI